MVAAWEADHSKHSSYVVVKSGKYCYLLRCSYGPLIIVGFTEAHVKLLLAKQEDVLVTQGTPPLHQLRKLSLSNTAFTSTASLQGSDPFRRSSCPPHFTIFPPPIRASPLLLSTPDESKMVMNPRLLTITQPPNPLWSSSSTSFCHWMSHPTSVQCAIQDSMTLKNSYERLNSCCLGSGPEKAVHQVWTCHL